MQKCPFVFLLTNQLQKTVIMLAGTEKERVAMGTELYIAIGVFLAQW